MAYKLSSSFPAHSGDVRGIAPISDDFFISTGRDSTSVIWRRVDAGEGSTGSDWVESARFRGHEKCVSCVAVCLPKAGANDADSVNQALIFTGSHDKTINVYRPEVGSDPIAQLKGHEDAVCALTINSKRELISASWDKTARIWAIDELKCTQMLTGHNLAVWTVVHLETRDEVVTGSADKMVRIWKDGKTVTTLKGHEDCVRALCTIESINPNVLLSVANDAQLRVWHVPTGACLSVLYGHTNYIYSLSVVLCQGSAGNAVQLVTGGEDRSARVWHVEHLDEGVLGHKPSAQSSPVRGECQQCITHPCTSVWSVGVLPNGDVVTGANDGVVRVFTRDAQRTADAASLAEFERVVAQSSVTHADVGQINTADLPDEEAVLRSVGRQEGQTRLARTANGDVNVYQWSAAARHWEPVGKMVGTAASSGPGGSGSKQLYEGREYDHVFSVELDDQTTYDEFGHAQKRSLKLPYNSGENPWFAAQRFIDRHALSQAHLEEIAQFILRNTSHTIGMQSNESSEFVDPFTGAGRYVPGTGPTRPPGTGSDPFTGTGRYVPGSSAAPAATNTNAISLGKRFTYFPESVCIAFEQANVTAICDKLRQLGTELNDVQFDDAHVTQLRFALDSQSADAARGLLAALHGGVERWPPAKRFPLVDLLRVAVVRNADFAQTLFADAARDDASSSAFFTFLGRVALDFSRPAAASQMLALRFVANALHSPAGARFFLDTQQPRRVEQLAHLLETFASRALVDAVERSAPTGASSSRADAEADALVRSKPLAVAASTCFLNAAVRLRPNSLNDGNELVAAQTRACAVFGSACNWLAALLAGGADTEPTFRQLVAIGTQLACLLLENDASGASVGSLQQLTDALLESRALFASVAESARLGATLDGIEQRFATSDADAAKLRQCVADVRACLQLISN